MSEPDDTDHVVAAITVMRQLHGRLDAIDAKIEALRSANDDMRHEARIRSLRNDVMTLFGHGIRAAWVFSSQLSVVFMAGYVWFAHQRYVEAIVTWIRNLFA